MSDDYIYFYDREGNKWKAHLIVSAGDAYLLVRGVNLGTRWSVVGIMEDGHITLRDGISDPTPFTVDEEGRIIQLVPEKRRVLPASPETGSAEPAAKGTSEDFLSWLK